MVLSNGEPVVFLDRGAKSLATFAGTESDTDWIDALQQLCRDGRLRAIELQKIDGEPALGHPVTELLLANGFAPGFKGPTYRP